MAGYRLSGPLCSTTYPNVDEGTCCQGHSPVPGPVCATRGTPMHKTPHGNPGQGSASRQIIEKARKQALDMLAKRLDDLDKWDAEMKRLAVNPQSRAIDELMKPLSPAGDATRD